MQHHSPGLWAQPPRQFLTVKSAPIQAMSSLFLQENTVENTQSFTEIWKATSTAFPSSSPQEIGQSSRTFHVVILRHFCGFNTSISLVSLLPHGSPSPISTETADERTSPAHHRSHTGVLPPGFLQACFHPLPPSNSLGFCVECYVPSSKTY